MSQPLSVRTVQNRSRNSRPSSTTKNWNISLHLYLDDNIGLCTVYDFYIILQTSTMLGNIKEHFVLLRLSWELTAMLFRTEGTVWIHGQWKTRAAKPPESCDSKHHWSFYRICCRWSNLLLHVLPQPIRQKHNVRSNIGRNHIGDGRRQYLDRLFLFDK